jgi:hypothetical protein
MCHDAATQTWASRRSSTSCTKIFQLTFHRLAMPMVKGMIWPVERTVYMGILPQDLFWWDLHLVSQHRRLCSGAIHLGFTLDAACSPTCSGCSGLVQSPFPSAPTSQSCIVVSSLCQVFPVKLRRRCLGCPVLWTWPQIGPILQMTMTRLHSRSYCWWVFER